MCITLCFSSSALISVSRPLWGPTLSVSRRRDLPTVFMGSGQGFNHKALAIVETVGKVLVSAGFEVLGSLRGICCCICHEEHNEILSAASSDTPDPVIGLDLCTETFSWLLTLGTRQTGWTSQWTDKNTTEYDHLIHWMFMSPQNSYVETQWWY